MRAFVLSGGRNPGATEAVPFTARLGLLVLAAGFVIDFIYHLEPHAARSSQMGVVGHIVTLAGMVLALLGVIATAVRLRRHRRQERR